MQEHVSAAIACCYLFAFVVAYLFSRLLVRFCDWLLLPKRIPDGPLGISTLRKLWASPHDGSTQDFSFNGEGVFRPKQKT